MTVYKHVYILFPHISALSSVAQNYSEGNEKDFHENWNCTSTQIRQYIDFLVKKGQP